MYIAWKKCTILCALQENKCRIICALQENKCTISCAWQGHDTSPVIKED